MPVLAQPRVAETATNKEPLHAGDLRERAQGPSERRPRGAETGERPALCLRSGRFRKWRGGLLSWMGSGQELLRDLVR